MAEKIYTIHETHFSKAGRGRVGYKRAERLYTGTFEELAKTLHAETGADLHWYHDLPRSTRAPKTVRGIVSTLNRATRHAEVLANRGGYDLNSWSEWELA